MSADPIRDLKQCEEEIARCAAYEGPDEVGAGLWYTPRPMQTCPCGKSFRARLNHGKRQIYCGTECRRNAGHRLSQTPEYRVWAGIIKRCRNRKYREWHLYGGRGIKVCERWLRFENFYCDMGERPSCDQSIDRIDNNGDYCPENCRWATKITQANNCRSNRVISFGGETKSVAEWSRSTGLPYRTILSRLCLGWSADRALTEKLGECSSRFQRKNGHYVLAFGETKSLMQWAREYGMSFAMLKGRLKFGWPPEQALVTPKGVTRRNAPTLFNFPQE